MKQNIQLWGTRFIGIVAIVFAAQHWGTPMYKQYFTPKKVEAFIPTGKVKEGKFVISFNQIGSLAAEKTTPVISEISGKIITLVNEGAAVKPGDVLCEMDTTDINKEVRNADISYQLAQADADRTKADLGMLKETNKTDVAQQEAQYKFAQEELNYAKQQLAKKQRLADKKLVALTEVESAQTDVRAKELEVTKGEMQLSLKNKEVKSKEDQQAAQVATKLSQARIAKESLEDVKRRVGSAVLKANSSGMVVIGEYWRDGHQKYKVGDVVERRQMVCEVPDLSSMQVKVKVGEADAPRIHVGLPVLIRLEAVPNKIFHGTIKEVSPLATESSPWEVGTTAGQKNFSVIIAVKEVDPKTLKPGITADIEFLCDMVKDAVYVPIEAVNERSGKTFVYVKKGKRFERVDVKTGKHNDNYIVITKGLKKGQIVALRDPTRPLDEQEAGSSAPGADEKKEKSAAPLPEPAKKK